MTPAGTGRVGAMMSPAMTQAEAAAELACYHSPAARYLRGQAALDEASRVLAMTEPDSHHCMLGSPFVPLFELSEFYPNTHPLRDDGAALASSLSAFLAAPDPAAWLAQQASK